MKYLNFAKILYTHWQYSVEYFGYDDAAWEQRMWMSLFKAAETGEI